ncbi:MULTISPECIES: beta-ketoacyl-[acyl-carrier-protein] synthase family protein [Streptomyces]|uniref:3-oxoacyl-ACP synthase n=1 Tax=Streptomyces TaxID=1883 RepID=UPI00099880EB|nr:MULTISPECIES: 3-oxoacyl-ACP synthase [Streptomyces]
MTVSRVPEGPAPLAVRATGWQFPETVRDTARLPELSDLTPAERGVLAGLGIEHIRADDVPDAAALATGAAKRALATAGLTAAEVRALVVVESRAPQTLLSSEATRIQELLGARDAVTFSVGGLGCVSIAPALLTARGLLAADPDLGHVLVTHGSTPATPGRYRHPVTVNGDGGGALLLSRTGPVRVLDSVQETDGRYWNLFEVAFRDVPSAQWRERCQEPAVYSFQLAVQTRNRLTTLLDKLLARHGMTRTDVAGYLTQNLSVGSFGFTEESLGITVLPACRDNLREYGHLGPNDVFFNLYTALERKELGEGDRAVLINVSPVAAWSVLLVEIGAEPVR